MQLSDRVVLGLIPSSMQAHTHTQDFSTNLKNDFLHITWMIETAGNKNNQEERK